MDYNQFTYYRANPYVNSGYMPPIALQNRHKPDFLTEIPMGEEHLGKIGKKMFSNNAHRSNISNQNILKSPQRYPYENRIALDKQYERNLNTIDIQGASGGTLVSQAVRNKMKARQQIIRRSQQFSNNNISQLEPIINGQAFQQQKRRKIAYQQYVKDQQIKQINENKQKMDRNEQRYNQMGSNRKSPSQNMRKNVEQNMQSQYYMKKRSQMQNNDDLARPRYQSIDLSRLRQNNELARVQNIERRHRNEENDQNGLSTAESGKQQQNYLILANDRKSLRLQNPTNLSSQGSIHLAARNIIKGQ